MIRWTETTAPWTRNVNPYRRHEAIIAGRHRLLLERDQFGDGVWLWRVRVVHETGDIELPGGDLPDNKAKQLALGVVKGRLEALLAELEGAPHVCGAVAKEREEIAQFVFDKMEDGFTSLDDVVAAIRSRS